MNRSTLLLTLCALAAVPSVRGAANSIYDFNDTQVGEVPGDCLVLDGRFAVSDFEGDKVLELPGSPLGSHGLLFGSSAKENVAVQARIHGTRKGRRYPAFAVSLGGVSGYRLQVTPAKRALELMKGDEVVQSAPWTWESSVWTVLRLELRKVGDAVWQVRGKAWTADEPEPGGWVLERQTADPPINGKAGVWGKPFSGTAIRFDDLLVEPVR